MNKTRTLLLVLIPPPTSSSLLHTSHLRLDTLSISLRLPANTSEARKHRAARYVCDEMFQYDLGMQCIDGVYAELLEPPTLLAGASPPSNTHRPALSATLIWQTDPEDEHSGRRWLLFWSLEGAEFHPPLPSAQCRSSFAASR